MASEIDHALDTTSPATSTPAPVSEAATGPVAERLSASVSTVSAISARDDRLRLVPRRTRMVPISTFEVPGVIRPIAQPDGWTDVLTGADGPRFWDRIVLSEQARVSRYHRDHAERSFPPPRLDRWAEGRHE